MQKIKQKLSYPLPDRRWIPTRVVDGEQLWGSVAWDALSREMAESERYKFVYVAD